MVSSYSQHIFMANSAYSLFTYLLLFPAYSDTTQFIVGPALHTANLPHKICFDPSSEQNADLDSFKKMLAESPCRNFSFYVNLTTPGADWFLDKSAGCPLYALSDGLSDYDRFQGYYQDDRITGCYSTNDIIGHLTHEKLKTFDVGQLWENLNKNQKDKIGAIFHMSSHDLETAHSRPVILITQPLSEDNMMDETDKIELYKRIINQYGAQNVVLKPHPREKTNWAHLFPEIPVMPQQIPVELLTRLVRLNKVATFFSTAAFGSVADEKIDFYSANFALLKSYHPDKNRIQNQRTFKSVAVSDIEETYRPHKGCHWCCIPDEDGRFYHPFSIDTAGIPVYVKTPAPRHIKQRVVHTFMGLDIAQLGFDLNSSHARS